VQADRRLDLAPLRVPRVLASAFSTRARAEAPLPASDSSSASHRHSRCSSSELASGASTGPPWRGRRAGSGPGERRVGARRRSAPDRRARPRSSTSSAAFGACLAMSE
jgi:hypothetical protein